MAQSKVKIAKAIYRFAVDGTAVGDVTLAETATLPVGAIVTNVWTNETTALTGSTDIDVVVGAQVITAACDFTGADTGLKLNPGTEAVPIQITTAADIKLHNDGDPITAGVVEIYLEYIY
jgi:hypothetical protein